MGTRSLAFVALEKSLDLFVGRIQVHLELSWTYVLGIIWLPQSTFVITTAGRKTEAEQARWRGGNGKDQNNLCYLSALHTPNPPKVSAQILHVKRQTPGIPSSFANDFICWVYNCWSNGRTCFQHCKHVQFQASVCTRPDFRLFFNLNLDPKKALDVMEALLINRHLKLIIKEVTSGFMCLQVSARK